MTRSASAPPRPAEATAGPAWSPPAHQLDDLECLLLQAYGPLRGFLGPQDLSAVVADGRLADGVAWPLPVALRVPSEVAERAVRHGSLVLLDEEGAEVGAVRVERIWPASEGGSAVAGPVEALAGTERGSHRGLRRSAWEVSRPARLLGVPLAQPLHAPQIAQLREAAHALGAAVRLLPITGTGRQAGGLDGPALVRTALAAADELDADVVPVPVPCPGDPDRDRVLLALVAQAYGATHVPAPLPDWPGPLPASVELPKVVRHRRAGAWALLESVPGEERGGGLAEDVPAEVERLVWRGDAVPGWMAGPVVVRELRRSRRQGGPGFSVLLTGLSGSGKSTVGRALHSALLERSGRSVTLLDGDVVRRMLSSELTFSRPHRELNVRRIGWVAAEVTRHGGIAVCTPIAPYAASRAEMRRLVGQHGGFLLVHVATSLEVCEARDRKGLYARARAGSIPEFTGVSDPYELPHDADIVIDTAITPVAEAVEILIATLEARGWLRLEPEGG